jgi:hypothetical protein
MDPPHFVYFPRLLALESLTFYTRHSLDTAQAGLILMTNKCTLCGRKVPPADRCLEPPPVRGPLVHYFAFCSLTSVLRGATSNIPSSFITRSKLTPIDVEEVLPSSFDAHVSWLERGHIQTPGLFDLLFTNHHSRINHVASFNKEHSSIGNG